MGCISIQVEMYEGITTHLGDVVFVPWAFITLNLV
jgi:hypothetical protein